MFFFCSYIWKKNIRNFLVSDIASSLRKYKKFFKLGARKSHFSQYKKLFQNEFFLRAWKLTSLKIRLENPISENIKKFHFAKYKKMHQLAIFVKTFNRRCLKVFWICLEFWIYQCSKYASSSKYVKILNIFFGKYTKVPFPEKYMENLWGLKLNFRFGSKVRCRVAHNYLDNSSAK